MAASHSELLEAAIGHHQSGRLADAERLYREILAADARHADALHLLGVIAHQMGQNEAAAALIGEAVAINGAKSAYHSNLGIALQALNRLDEALAAYDGALRLQPDFANAHCNRGNVLKELGRMDEALASYEASLCIEPDFAKAHSNRGNALRELGRLDKSLAACDTALRIKPDYASAHSNRGGALERLGRLSEALTFYETALCIAPDLAEALYNRGNVLRELGRFDKALAACGAALRIKPDYANAHSTRGTSLERLGRLSEALASYEAVLCIAPDHVDALHNRGYILTALGYLDEAPAFYEAALRIKPDFVSAYSGLILGLHYGSGIEGGAIQSAAQRFAHLYKAVSPSFANFPDPGRRLRIGYVSGDFGRHSVSYFLAPVLANHDRDAFELFCYSTRPRDDDMTARLRASADHWRTLAGLTDDLAAALVRSDQIDILIDLSGHTAHNRLTVFAQKPAPVQVSWLGFPGTTGLAAMDYRVVDAITDPEGRTADWTSESLIRLPHGFLCFDPPREAPDVASPPCLDGLLTFGSFNNPAKLSLATLNAWADLMRRLPESRLLLKGLPFGDEAARALLLERLESRGVTADRITLLAWAPDRGGHLGLYGKIDVALDPFPYNGTTTTCEALWMGVPVVTLEGTRHSGRVGASLLTRLGLQELIAADTESYIRIAADLAADRERLSKLRQSLRPRMSASPLCDGPAFTRDLEAAFRSMWRNWCGKAAA